MAASPRKAKKPQPASAAAKSGPDRAARARATRAKERLADKMLRDLRERVEALNASADKLLARLS
jgi:hypothetical protein